MSVALRAAGVWLLAACFVACSSEVPSADPPANTSGGGGASSGGTGGSVGGSSATGAGGSGAAGGASSGGSGGDGGAGGQLGAPIDAPNQQWTWVDFPDAKCANGAPTGIGINLSDVSPNALIYLQGGGACWDEGTCYTAPAAINITTGFGSADLAPAHAGLDATVFDRADVANPFRDWSFVFVPYCTGDMHAGTRIATYGANETHHVGYDNMGEYLHRLVPTFAGAGHVVLTGSSAGGYGAGFNYHRAALAFDPVRVDLIDDGAPFISEPIANAAREAAWRSAWGLDDIMPNGCATCATKFYGLMLHGIEQNPNSRAALLSHNQDGIIGLYFALDAVAMAWGHVQLAGEVYNPNPHANWFVLDGTAHTMLGDWSVFSVAGIGLKEWIGQMVSDDPAWSSVGP